MGRIRCSLMRGFREDWYLGDMDACVTIRVLMFVHLSSHCVWI